MLSSETSRIPHQEDFKKRKIPQQFGGRIADNLLVLQKGVGRVEGIFKNYFVHLKSFSRFSWRTLFTSPELNCWRTAEVFPLQQQPQFSYGTGISLCSLKHSFTWKALCGTYCKCRTITQLLSSDAGMRKLEGGNRKDINTSLQSFIFYSQKAKSPVSRAPREICELLCWWTNFFLKVIHIHFIQHLNKQEIKMQSLRPTETWEAPDS